MSVKKTKGSGPGASGHPESEREGSPLAGRSAGRPGAGAAPQTKPIIAITDHPFKGTAVEEDAASAVGAELRIGNCRTPEEVLALTHDADAVLNCYAPMPAAVVMALEHCQIIARYGIGVDTIDLEAATTKGIKVTNVPDYCTDEVSDHAMALILGWARKVVVADRATRAGRWALTDVVPIRRIQGQTLGLVGMGKIARRLAEKARAFGLQVIASDPYVSEADAAQLGIRLTTLDQVLATSDYISVHAPLTPETRGLINAAALARMRSTAYLFNTARGPLVDEQALAEALRTGGIAGAALDVTPREPLPADSPLRDLPNLIITPHIAYYSEEAQDDLQRLAVAEVVRALRGEAPASLVNRAVLQQTPA